MIKIPSQWASHNFSFLFAAVLLLVIISVSLPGQKARNLTLGNYGDLYRETAEKVLPQEGINTKISFGDSLVKLVEFGVIDLEKIRMLYADRGGLPDGEWRLLTVGSLDPVVVNADNAGFLVNVLWGLGIANQTDFNNESPLWGDSLYNFASTGGWILGHEDNGGVYFNRFDIIDLTPKQEELVLKVAKNTYRPCCNNSTFFQDCNHGSALLGALELGASQGLSEEELYKAALAFNSFWFPDTYVKTALYFKIFKNTDWRDVDAARVMSFDYSSASGWYNNIEKKIAAIPGLIPESGGGGKCGV